MCGIAGIVGPGVGTDEDRSVLARMLFAMGHRGPDDGHAVVGDGYAIGARRLAIVDVAHGRQPATDARGEVVVALNGELYDHAALRRDLEARGHALVTGSDTEVLLHLVRDEGEACLDRLEGMYAFAAYDTRTRTLLLARDRLGEKPLVGFTTDGPQGRRLVFASELQALARHPDAPRDLDPDALALYLLHRFVPAPRTPFRDVWRLPPAHRLVWRDGRATTAPYWSLPTPDGARPASDDDVLARLDAAVASRQRAEVPVGLFLSGGLDSGAIACLAARRGPLETFTLRPADAAFDEGEAARQTATALGATHHEIPVDEAALLAGFEEVFASIDEPIGDSSLVPTLLLAREARRRVKVVLGGEGADELFGGYPTYLGARMARYPRLLPGPLRRFTARRLAGGPSNVGTRWLLRRLFEGADLPLLERHLAWFGAFLPAEQAGLFRPEARPAIVGPDLFGPVEAAAAPAMATGDPVDALLRVDLLLHLPDALLAKVDRTTMRASLEARAPFLERRLVEAAARTPAREKVRRGRTKVGLRRALREVVPAALLSRRKRGFAVPVAAALRGPLGDRLAERLDTASLARTWLEPAPLRALLAEHRAGRADHARRLYPLLALLEWSERFARRA